MAREDPTMRRGDSDRREVCSGGGGACGNKRGHMAREDSTTTMEEPMATKEDA